MQMQMQSACARRRRRAQPRSHKQKQSVSARKTKNGFVPNFSAAGAKSQDRSEEMIGSKVLLEIYKQYGEDWIVELLFDDCLDWLNWAHEHRRYDLPSGTFPVTSS